MKIKSLLFAAAAAVSLVLHGNVILVDTYDQLSNYIGTLYPVYVRDASGRYGDPNVTSGGALYVYDTLTKKFKIAGRSEDASTKINPSKYVPRALYDANINRIQRTLSNADIRSQDNATEIVSIKERLNSAESNSTVAVEHAISADERVSSLDVTLRGYTDEKVSNLKIDIITNTAVRMRGTLTIATNFTNQVKVDTLAAAASDASSKDSTLAETLRDEIGTAKTEAVGAAKDYTDGKTEGLLSAATAEAMYQPKGDYLTEHQDISGKANVGDAYTKAESDAKYLTEHQDISGKLDASTAAETYQPKGSYLVPADIEGKADKSFLFKNNLFYNELVYGAIKSIFWNETTGGGIRLENSDTGVKSAFSVNDGGGGGIYGQIYAVKKIDGKSTGTRITITDNGAFYTVANTYMWTPEDEIAVKRDLSAYQPAGAYLVAADIEGKLDSTVAAETYQPKGNYLTEHQSLADYAKTADVAAAYQPKGDYILNGDALELPLKVKKNGVVYQIDVVDNGGDDISLSVNKVNE